MLERARAAERRASALEDALLSMAKVAGEIARTKLEKS